MRPAAIPLQLPEAPKGPQMFSKFQCFAHAGICCPGKGDHLVCEVTLEFCPFSSVDSDCCVASLWVHLAWDLFLLPLMSMCQLPAWSYVDSRCCGQTGARLSAVDVHSRVRVIDVRQQTEYTHCGSCFDEASNKLATKCVLLTLPPAAPDGPIAPQPWQHLSSPSSL